MSHPVYETFNLGDWSLQKGGTLPNAHLAYKTFGDPKNPAILYPTWYSGLISDNFWLIDEDKSLNPEKYYIIIPALFGNGQSTSPSNTSRTLSPFPLITFHDNVRAQHHLLTTHLHISHLHCVIGWSMGAGQTYQWITQYPEFVDLAIPFCGSAKTSLHNQVFLEGVKSALLAGKGVGGGGICVNGEGERGEWSEREREVGLKALGRVYAGWGFSQTFYRERLFETHLGYKDLEAFMVGFWEKWALSKDPENMLTMLHTWQTADCSLQPPYHGSFAHAMRGIKAKTLVLPAETDLYFPPEDSALEISHMTPGIGELRIFPSVWGHWAGGPGDSEEDVRWLDGEIGRFFERNG